MRVKKITVSIIFILVLLLSVPAFASTLEDVNSLDLVSMSVTGLSTEQLSMKELNKRIKDYGTCLANGTLPYDEYVEAMNYKWIDMTLSGNKPAGLDVNLKNSYTYAELEEIMFKLSQFEGVYLYKIGESLQGRNIYDIEIDFPSDSEKRTVLLTGGVHSRETAGPEFLLKQICNLLADGSKEAKRVLATTRFEIVPCVNPDGREGICFDTKNYSYSEKSLWKAAANGTDIGRNFPGLSIGYLKKGVKKTKTESTTADKIYYYGDYFGCNPETKALMKFVYYFVAVEKADVLVDYHQQGRIMYAGKAWQTKAQEQRCIDAANKLGKLLSKGNSIPYIYWPEDDGYGLNGGGTTLSDYACAIACGAKFSPAYGSLVFNDDKKEYPLIMISDLDKTSLKVSPVNDLFATYTIEIGYGNEYLGYSDSARKLLAEEYNKYHFNTILYNLP